nr:MAG TPA: hypothetical protein [Caudoviricetes sp.]
MLLNRDARDLPNSSVPTLLLRIFDIYLIKAKLVSPRDALKILYLSITPEMASFNFL